MSRAADDAFSSLISNVAGVDTSGFVKRSLNDLKPKQKTPKQETVSEDIKETTAIEQSTTTSLDFNFGSLELDSLGQQQNTKQVSNEAVQLEDLFEDIPGCEEHTSTIQTNEPTPLIEEQTLILEEEATPLVQEQVFIQEEPIIDEEFSEDEFTLEEEEPVSLEDQGAEDEVKDSSRPSKFEKYKNRFNKHAAKLGKQGMKAMKQGIGAAQDWVDRYVEDRKQSAAENQKTKENDREIKQFLADMEQLSHHRRELLMSEIPADFFQRVMDYVERHQLSVDHLFITSHEQETQNQEEESEVFESEESMEDEEEADLLGLSSSHQPDLVETEHEEVPLADPDDLDSFFAGGVQSTSAQEVEAPDLADVFVSNPTGDLMQFGESSSSCSSTDYQQLYKTLKESGKYTDEQIRTLIRQKRLEEKEGKMQKALEAKMERDRDEEENRELLLKLKDQHLKTVVEWKERHSNNMRGLLTTLESVLWEDSGWKPLTVADVLEPVQVKKAYMKANLIIHPDKVKQKGGSAEQVALADMVFNVLKEGWKEFQT